MNKVQTEIKNNIDKNYAKFSAKLIPNIDISKISGLRTPIAKKIAKSFANTKQGDLFLNLNHDTIDENNVHGLMLGYLSLNFDDLILKVEEFLPYIDNWATCDLTCMNLKIFKNQIKLKEYLIKWLNSNHCFTQRFAIVCLLTYFLDNNFDESDLNLVNIVSQDYYVNMAISWYYSVALVKQYQKTLKMFEIKIIKNKWVHNKSIQKAVESFRIDKDKKIYLKTLKIY